MGIIGSGLYPMVLNYSRVVLERASACMNACAYLVNTLFCDVQKHSGIILLNTRWPSLFEHLVLRCGGTMLGR